MVYYCKLFLNILDTFTNQSLGVTAVSVTWSPRFFTAESPSWPTNSWQLWAGSENCPLHADECSFWSWNYRYEPWLGSCYLPSQVSVKHCDLSHDRSHNRRVTHYRSHPPLCLQKWHQPFKITGGQSWFYHLCEKHLLTHSHTLKTQ